MRIATSATIGALIGTALALAVAQAGLSQDPAPQAGAAGELVMFERDGCVWCAQWDREIGPIYPKTDEAKHFPLRRINLDKSQAGSLALAQPIHFSPTFVLAACGREIGRIVGYPGDELFWGLLSIEIKRLQSQPPLRC